MTSRQRALALALTVVVAVSVAGAGYGLASRQSVTSTNTDAFKKSATSTSLPATAGGAATVVGFILPAGSWVLSADASAVNFGAAEYVRCAIWAGNTPLNGATTMIGASNTVGNISLAAVRRSRSQFTVRLRCTHDHALGGISIDPGATLWAHRSASLALP